MNRKTIIAEVEEKVDRAAVFANAAHARREVLQQEILESGIVTMTTLPKHAPGIRLKLCRLVRLELMTVHGIKPSHLLPVLTVAVQVGSVGIAWG